MENSALIGEKRPSTSDQLKQVFWGTQIAAIGYIVYIMLFDKNAVASTHTLYFRLDLILFSIGFAGTSLLLVVLDRGKYALASTSFFGLWAVLIALVTWFCGGIYSLFIPCFFVLFLFAALFADRIVYISIYIFQACAVALIGYNQVEGWFPASQGAPIEGIPRIIGGLLLTTFSFAVCWFFGNVVKRSFKDLKLQNQLAAESKAVIEKLAGTDTLTGLLNRNGAEVGYQTLLKKLNLSHECIIVYFMDLDDFKNINSLFDHYAGDELLKILSSRLTSLKGEDGFACRFGGDEFVLAIRAEQSFDDEVFAEELLKSLSQPHSILGIEAAVTTSLGIVKVSDLQSSFNSVCKKADIAMTKAKRSGKNNYYRYSDKLHSEYMRNLNIVSCLKNAISNDLLELHFQPKVNLLTNKVEGAEALLRWVRGNAEGIGPDEFIPVIESTELIHSIGDWVINEACLSCKQWHDAGNELTVAVNISAFQLTRSTFYQKVVEALERNQIPPSFLEIEITEHSLLQEIPLVNTQLELLKNLGVGLAIDDFGTGYSNMGYLARLHIDVLKLDRSFVSNISASEEYRVIIHAIIRMAKVLGMKVVAEGIETEHEREILAGLECDYGQGYLWAPAVLEGDLLQVIGSLQQEPRLH
jgi:diguanylate cyclase (GGDEF)-like protein